MAMPSDCAPPASAKNAEAREHQDTNHPSFRFLDLPLEIRSSIYGYFDRPQGKDERTTRESLMMVSVQVSTECSPIFFREMEFHIHKGERGSVQHFTNHFLASLPDYKLRNIRKLVYYVDEARGSNIRGTSGMVHLRRTLLQRIESLDSLEEVVIRTLHWIVFEQLLGLAEEEIVDADADEMWRQMCLIDPRWKRAEEGLIGDSCPLQSWNITRRMATDSEDGPGIVEIESSDDIDWEFDGRYAGMPERFFITNTYRKPQKIQTKTSEPAHTDVVEAV
ncbi:hypothetical protein PV08_06406 [Exophiala spinifera]|uniref:F-box domain-containing protein n=1 Tax=Exophiala spinifera TaxID=91928 RepID=A0A0D2BCK4_9EURO|nr:uncharacterized protein PV08_06406 [Exophiala spinifera]KIW16355.1 hypothetical protein PV08_06406 [Exophiala spinifera]